MSMSLCSGTRTGRGLTTTSCDDTCIDALNIKTLKKLTSCVVLKTASQMLNKRIVWGQSLTPDTQDSAL